MLYLISLILIFTIENDCMSNIPWCSVMGVVLATRGHYFLNNGHVCTKSKKPLSLRHLIATNRKEIRD